MIKTIDADVAHLIRENNLLIYQNKKLAATLEYLAMMTDVELPEQEDEDDE